jgi:hypothetical protein
MSDLLTGSLADLSEAMMKLDGGDVCVARRRLYCMVRDARQVDLSYGMVSHACHEPLSPTNQHGVRSIPLLSDPHNPPRAA